MTNKGTVLKTIIAAVIAIVLATSSAAFVSSVKADAASYKGSAQAHAVAKSVIPEKTTKKNTFASSYCFKAASKAMKGYDYTFKADTKNIKVKCKYDFKAHKYTFKFTGTSYGLSHITLKYKVSDKKWTSVKMNLFVDPENYIMRTA